MVIAVDASSAAWLEAISTAVAAAAAMVAGFFAYRAWHATKQSADASRAGLETAQAALQVENDRRADERAESLSRARAEASRLVARGEHLEEEGAGGVGTWRLVLENTADVAFEEVIVVVSYFEGEQLAPYGGDNFMQVAVIEPGEAVSSSQILPYDRTWLWDMTYRDLDGRFWRKGRATDSYTAQPTDEPHSWTAPEQEGF